MKTNKESSGKALWKNSSI